MPRSEEAAMWYAAVYRAVQEIPYGKVTSYGHIADLLGHRKYLKNIMREFPMRMDRKLKFEIVAAERPRQVGVCLKFLPRVEDQPDAQYNSATVPWQRVINAKGEISPRGVGGAARQEAVLALEGVEVGRSGLGERTVDFAKFGWFPGRLPSEAADDEDGDAEEQG
nr:alkyltransferase-like protein 1 [Quercus suber]